MPDAAPEMAAACTRYAELKAGLAPDTPRRSVERTAFTHALHCPTCQPIADRLRLDEDADRPARRRPDPVTTKPRWRSQLRWDDQDRTTHDGKTYELWAHGYQQGTSSKGEPIHSTRDAWHLHEVLANGQTYPRELSNPLSGNKRQAQRLAELWILGWKPAPGHRSAEHGYREMWRAPDKALHPIADVLSGVVPH